MAEELQVSVGEEGAGRNRSRVGALLRGAREAKGRDLNSVSQQLRIRSVYLRAIEDGDFGSLPGTTYAVGFVRTYADYLGLDGPDIVRRFREEVEELGRRTQLVFPAAPAEGKIPGGAILLIAVVIAAIAYGAWFYMSDRDRSLVGLVPEVPAELKAALDGSSQAVTATQAAPGSAPSAAASAPADATATGPAPASSAETPAAATDASRSETTAGMPTAADDRATQTLELAPALPADGGAADDEDQVPPEPDNLDGTSPAPGVAEAPAEAPPQVDGAAGAPAPAGAPAATTTTAATATVSAAASGATPSDGSPAGRQQAAVPAPPAAPSAPIPTEEPPSQGQDYGVTNSETRVVLVARQESWVQVSSPDQEVWTRVLRPGDRYRVPNEPDLMLATGNAGGLDIVVDGRKIPSLGPVGVVRRGISLDPTKLLDGTAIP